jgi:hypothetical protein
MEAMGLNQIFRVQQLIMQVVELEAITEVHQKVKQAAKAEVVVLIILQQLTALVVADMVMVTILVAEVPEDSDT